MRTYLIAASIAALAAGSAAHSETICRQDNSGRIAATVAGAGIGAVLGNVIGGGHAAGTVIGGVAGGIAGNQLARGSDHCFEAYGYYDEGGRWHANRIAAGEAHGYYDRYNVWVEGPPNGYYDNENRWIAFSEPAAGAGYYDRDGRFVPIGVTGYYAADGEWIDATAPGHYDRGRWVEGPAYGHYDVNGVWIADRAAAGPTGYWAARTEPGYYDANGHWVRGQVSGYYDARGHWVTMGMVAPAGNVAYNSRDTRVREARIEERIERMRERGELSPSQARHAQDQLADIRRDEEQMRYSGGGLSPHEEAEIHHRLDDLGVLLRADRDDYDNDNGPG
jgi:hypothetical protein